MFDFAQIGALAERIETFTTDLDSRLEELNNRVKTQNSLLALLILTNYQKGREDSVYEALNSIFGKSASIETIKERASELLGDDDDV